MEKNEVKIENPSESKENNPKISKKRRKIYTIVLGICLAVVAALFSLNVYSALNYEIGYFYDYSMAPTINKTITNEGVPYEYNNFKNVEDEKSARRASSVLLFIILSLVGFGIGLIIFYVLGYAFQAINIDILNFNIFEFYKCLTEPNFYIYACVFAFQTLVVLFWNYVSRKKFIYKAPGSKKVKNVKKVIYIKSSKEGSKLFLKK